MPPPDKKRSSITDLQDLDNGHHPPNAYRYTASNNYSNASSSYSRQRGASSAYPTHDYPPRSDSPPASAYFTSFPNSGHGIDPIRSAGDVGSHFAYSTTLRRHHDPLENSLMSPKVFHAGVPELGIVHRTLRAFGAERFMNLSTPVSSNINGNSNGRPSSGFGTENGGAAAEETPGSRFAHMPEQVRKPRGLSYSVLMSTPQDVIAYFHSDPAQGISSSTVPSLRASYGYNEFSVEPSSSLIVKFIETIYESPLNLLLLGSAAVSAIMGNIDDAVSITIAILIVLTGETPYATKQEVRLINLLRSWVCARTAI